MIKTEKMASRSDLSQEIICISETWGVMAILGNVRKCPIKIKNFRERM